MTVRRLAVIGLGKLGSCLAAALAVQPDIHVMGYDLDPHPLAAITRGEAPVAEPGLVELVRATAGRSLFVTSDPEDLAGADTVFIVVPTPSDPTGRFDNRYVLDATRALGPVLRGHDAVSVVVVSTVMPGSCAGPIRAALEGVAGRTVGDRLSLVYSPEFIALGSVVHGLTHPDVLLIGCDDDQGVKHVEPVLRALAQNEPQVHRLTLTEAELSKLALNVALSVKIAYANEVAHVAEQIGADGVQVLEAVGDDSRIGRKFLTPGGPASGPCLPRDLAAFERLAADVNRPAHVTHAADRVHRGQAALILQRLHEIALPGDGELPVIGVLGAAYKAGTAITDESIGLRIATGAAEAGYPVVIHDPKADLGGLAVRVVANGQQVADEADVVLVATAWSEYKTIDYHGKPVFDLWGVAPPAVVHRFGVGR